MRGKAISEFRSPNALPRAPTPLGTEGVLRCCVCCVVDFCLYAAVLRVERYADLVPGFFNIYGGTLCRSRFWILWYLWWYTMPISSLYSSIFIVVRGADLVPVFFNIYSGMLGQSRSCILWYLWCNAMPISFLYSLTFMVQRYADLIPVFFDIYSETLGRSGPVFFDIYDDTLGRSRSCILWYLWCNAMPIWSLYSSIFIVIRWANLIPEFFGTYSGTLRSSCPGILRYL